MRAESQRVGRDGRKPKPVCRVWLRQWYGCHEQHTAEMSWVPFLAGPAAGSRLQTVSGGARLGRSAKVLRESVPEARLDSTQVHVRSDAVENPEVVALLEAKSFKNLQNN